MDWARILAYVTTADQELLGRNEYLAAENRILKAQLNGQPKLSDAEAENRARVSVVRTFETDQAYLEERLQWLC